MLDNESCDAVTKCVGALNRYADDQDGTPTKLRRCAERGVYAPVGVPRSRWENRRGARAQRYSDVKSTRRAPIEVCGRPAAQQWLVDARCNDSTHPFSDPDHAYASRVRNVGAGGRCGSIIDLYEVACREGTYKIYIDAYVCPQD